MNKLSSGLRQSQFVTRFLFIITTILPKGLSLQLQTQVPQNLTPLIPASMREFEGRRPSIK